MCSVMSHGIWARHRHSRLIAAGISQLALGQNLLGILLSPPAAGSDVDLGFLWSFGLVSAAVLGWGISGEAGPAALSDFHVSRVGSLWPQAGRAAAFHGRKSFQGTGVKRTVNMRYNKYIGKRRTRVDRYAEVQ